MLSEIIVDRQSASSTNVKINSSLQNYLLIDIDAESSDDRVVPDKPCDQADCLYAILNNPHP
jgi:hypothetical protein